MKFDEIDLKLFIELSLKYKFVSCRDGESEKEIDKSKIYAIEKPNLLKYHYYYHREPREEIVKSEIAMGDKINNYIQNIINNMQVNFSSFDKSIESLDKALEEKDLGSTKKLLLSEKSYYQELKQVMHYTITLMDELELENDVKLKMRLGS